MDRNRSERCRAWCAAALSRAIADGKLASAFGEGCTSGSFGNTEHYGTSACLAGTRDHGFCCGAAVFLFDSCADLQRSIAARKSSSGDAQSLDERESCAACYWHKRRADLLRQTACHLRPAHAVFDHWRLALRSADRA